MALGELTSKDAVLSAIEEYDALGADEFLKKHGFGPATNYVLRYGNRSYDSKAIAGVAYGYQYPDRGPLRSIDFAGGHQTVEPVLQKLGFEVVERNSVPTSVISADDFAQFVASRSKQKFADLSEDERGAYKRIHSVLERVGRRLVGDLGGSDKFALKITSGFSVVSGVRGALPKDLWFGVSSSSSELGMPQLFAIVSPRGLEYGFAPAIHPSDFYNTEIRQRVRDAVPAIYSFLPISGSPEAEELDGRLKRSGHWFFRRKTRLEPRQQDFESLDAWLAFLKSPEGTAWAGGSISAYVTTKTLETSDTNLAEIADELAGTFGAWMSSLKSQGVRYSLRFALASFLDRYPQIRSETAFGQHDELKDQMKHIKAELDALSVLKRYPHIGVSWSLGAGNWARIPWVALLDERETDSTQRGRYVVFLFPEDMSGVYLTLNQGVTDVVSSDGRSDGRRRLRANAAEIRRGLADLTTIGFKTDDGIDLKTDGALGQDYEASTVAYKFYAKSEIPSDSAIEADLDAALAAYSKLTAEKATSPTPGRFWIFQANPTMYDLDGALDELHELTWLVSHFAKEIAAGDRVALWKSGKQSGLTALGTILTDPAIMGDSPAEARFNLHPTKFSEPQMRVRLRIDKVIKPEISRSKVLADPTLASMTIITAPMGTNFAVTPQQETALMALINQEVDQTLAPKGRQRVWVYAPGRNAEFWDDFYEQSMMAIGWDDLGDLTSYGSVDELVAALDKHHPSDSRQSNNARTCFDFAQTVKPGDLVFAKRGRNIIIGHGTITGDYEFRDDRPQFKHVRKVRWESRGEWDAPETMALKTLTDITAFPSVVEQLRKLVAIGTVDPPSQLPLESRTPYTLDHALEAVFAPREDLERALRVWKFKKNLILQGPPGVGKSFLAKRLSYALMGFQDPTRLRTVQFHQSYSYEDFVQGYRPDGLRGFELKPGVFLEFCEKARVDPNEIYVFIIDEINRGNLSRIFGELMLPIEPDKRSPDWATKLAYAKSVEERFYVPPNVYILGLMNTADRSLSMVDYALRRRFGFVNLRPQFDRPAFKAELARAGVGDSIIDTIVDKMTSLNDEIGSDKANLGTGFCIGHSFFVPSQSSETFDQRWYEEIVETEIRPLLEEYWSDDLSHAERARSKLLSE